MDDDDAWLRAAACRGTSARLFFTTDPKYVKEAKKVCRTCTVVNECLSDCLKFEAKIGSRNGIFGGTTEAERDIIVDSRKPI